MNFSTALLLFSLFCAQYELLPQNTPRRMMVHVVSVDLGSASFLVTPGADTMPARTTSQFLDEFNMDVAINGGGFSPWWDHGPRDYYPLPGQPVTVRGFAASDGLIYSNGSSENTLFISEDNQVSFGSPVGPVYNAVSGLSMLLVDGQPVPHRDQSIHPRTAVGLSCDGSQLILMVVDGRQPQLSEGATLADLAGLMLSLGACDAVNLDGGGTSTLVIRDWGVVNSPIHAGVRGLQRPGGNHLGVRCDQ